MSTVHSPIRAIKWRALEWVLEVHRHPRGVNPVHPDVQLLQLWHRAGTYSLKAEECRRLQRIVIEWSEVSFTRQTTLRATYPVSILVPLVDAFVLTQQTGVRPKMAALHTMRGYSLHEREILRQALAGLPRGHVVAGSWRRLAIPDQGQASLLISLAEALDLLMRELEDEMLGDSKTSTAGLLGS